MKSRKREVIGLIPAAGKGNRVFPLPCSKELFPIGFRPIDKSNNIRPKVVSHYLLEKIRLADIKKAYIIIRKGKWDIPSYYGDGKMLDMNLGYLIMDLPYGVPYTLDQAFPFVKDAIIALGFPDMIFRPENAFVQLLARQEESGADIVLGLFPALQPGKTDMVELGSNGQIKTIQIKPDKSDLQYAWEIAVWNPTFTRFIHDCLIKIDIDKKNELQIGEIIGAAIGTNMKVETVLFESGNCLDIGTPEDLLKAIENSCEFTNKNQENCY